MFSFGPGIWSFFNSGGKIILLKVDLVGGCLYQNSGLWIGANSI